MRNAILSFAILSLLTAITGGCGDDGGNEADLVGVGWSCTVDADCLEQVCDDDATPCRQLVCLTQFTGGYCGLEGCTTHDECPTGSACVIHDDGTNYCFRNCVDKAECNGHRGTEEEANCSANIDYVTELSSKACVPPSSGT